MMSVIYTHPVYTYQFKIFNLTSKEQTYVIKAPNIPSPVPLPVDRGFPALYTCTLAPSASEIFTTEIISNSQEAHLFLIKGTCMVISKEGFLPQTSDVLIDFWKDEGGLKGDCCVVKQGVGWEMSWGWRAWSESSGLGRTPQADLSGAPR